MSKSKLVKNNVESVSKEIKNEAEVIHENLSADEQTLSDVKDYQLLGNDSNLLIVFYVQIMPDDFVMQLHRF